MTMRSTVLIYDLHFDRSPLRGLSSDRRTSSQQERSSLAPAPLPPLAASLLDRIDVGSGIRRCGGRRTERSDEADARRRRRARHRRHAGIAMSELARPRAGKGVRPLPARPSAHGAGRGVDGRWSAIPEPPDDGEGPNAGERGHRGGSHSAAPGRVLSVRSSRPSSGKCRPVSRRWRRKYGAYIAPKGRLYAGFSRGAFLGASFVAAHPDAYGRAVLIEGGHTPWTDDAAKQFATNGREAPAVRLWSAILCRRRAGRVGQSSRENGIETRVVYGSGEGHGYKKQVKDELRRSFDWVVEGDPNLEVRRHRLTLDRSRRDSQKALGPSVDLAFTTSCIKEGEAHLVVRTFAPVEIFRFGVAVVPFAGHGRFRGRRSALSANRPLDGGSPNEGYSSRS